MTTKELLHELIDELDDDDARDLLLFARMRQRPSQENVPSFAGMLHSGKGNLGRDTKRIVREELGSSE